MALATHISVPQAGKSHANLPTCKWSDQGIIAQSLPAISTPCEIPIKNWHTVTIFYIEAMGGVK
jgi:hypothetical protein